MCACTEPVRTGIGAVCVEYGRPKWPITMLNHTRTNTHTHKNTHTHEHPWYRIMFGFLFLAPYARTTRYEEAFFPWKTKEKKAHFARAPHDIYIYYIYICSKSRIVSLKGSKSECSMRFAALFSTRGGPFRLLLLPPCPPASTAPREGLHDGLLEGSCGWRRRRVMRKRLTVGTRICASF